MPPARDVPLFRRGGALSASLLPLSWLYRAAVATDRVIRPAPRPGAGRAPRVVSVGNLEVGGSGKTPLAMLLLERGLARGGRVAYVSRGYASRSQRGPLVTHVPADGDVAVARAGERVVARSHPDLALEIGDEGAMVAARVPGAALYFTRDKRRAVQSAAADGAGLVVLDDAFQSRGVARDLDIVLLDARAPLANGRVLPAGPLRESPRALERADAVVFNGASDAASIERAAVAVRRFLKPGARVLGLARHARLVPAGEGTGGAPARVLAVSGIARPEGFEASLAAAGVTCVAHDARRDHHRYTRRDAEAISARARSLGVDALATTEKDWAKLSRLGIDARVWVLRLEVELVGGELPA